MQNMGNSGEPTTTEELHRLMTELRGRYPFRDCPRVMIHPENLPLLQEAIPPGQIQSPMFGLPVVESPYVPKERWTGKYVLPDGSAVEADQVRVEFRFFEYGPEDLEFLLLAGIVQKEMERNLYLLNPPAMPSPSFPVLTYEEPRRDPLRALWFGSF